MKSPSARPPVLGHARFVACCAVALATALSPPGAPAATCYPVIGLSTWPVPPFTPAKPQQSLTFEVPLHEPITSFLYVLNLGCAPLDWKVRDVEPGTEADCSWISESPDSGTVQPGGAEPGIEVMAVTIRPFAEGGVHQTDLRFSSNDPVQPLIVVSLTIVVVAPTATTPSTFGQLKARFRDPQPQVR